MEYYGAHAIVSVATFLPSLISRRATNITLPPASHNCVIVAVRTLVKSLALLQAIDAAAIKAYAQKLLSGKASGVLVGDQSVMPKFDTVSSRFGS